MIVPIAHAGDWIINSLYVAPLLIVVGVLGYQTRKDRRELKREGVEARRQPPPPAPGPSAQ